MVRCKIAEDECKNGTMCCFTCNERTTCSGSCAEFKSAVDFEYNGCGAAEEVAEVVPFEKKYADVLKKVTEIEIAKKSLEAQETEMKVKLQAAMEEYGVTSLDNPYFNVTYKKASTRTSIDSTRLKKELPDIAEKYSKVSNVKASITIKVK